MDLYCYLIARMTDYGVRSCDFESAHGIYSIKADHDFPRQIVYRILEQDLYFPNVVEVSGVHQRSVACLLGYRPRDILVRVVHRD